MARVVIDQNTLRQYLLSDLSEEQREIVEERVLTDDQVFEELQLVKEDLVDQYVNKEMADDERKRFEQHFLTTAERRNELRQAKALARYAKRKMTGERLAEENQSESSVRSRPRASWLPWRLPAWSFALGVLLLAGVSVVTWRAFFYRSDVESGLAALKTTYRFQRPVQARISALGYAPLPNTRGNGESRVDPVSHQRAERLLLDAAQDHNAASYHALGLFYLTDLKFDQSIELLKKALQLSPNNATLQSDLGAALLEKAKLERQNGDEGKSVQDFAESLEHLNRALALSPSLLDALFNRALCRQNMELPQLAAEDWRQYLTRDPQSAWADEARQNLKTVESQTPKSSQNKDLSQQFLAAYAAHDDEAAWQLLCLNRDVGGVLIENELLNSYLKLEAEDRSVDAQASLAALSYASELELKRANDHFANDLVHYYQSSTRSRRALLSEARSLTSLGNQSLLKSKPEDAVDYYTKAKNIFASLGDEPESLYLNYPLAHAYLLMQQSERSLAMFQAVVRDSEASQYQWLASQALSGVANVQVGLSDYSAALETNNRSRKISERIGDVKGLMKTADQLSILYTRLGNYSAAIEHQAQGLSLINKFPVDARQAWRSNFLMATPLHLMGLDAAAEDFQQESLRNAKTTDNPYYISRSYIGLGVIYGAQRNYDEALKSVRLAFDAAKNIASEATKTDTLAYSSLQLGHLYRQAGDFNNALASYDEVLKLFDSSLYPAFVYAAHKGKLLSCIAQGGCPSVEQEIQTTVDLFENYRSKILEEENKFVFFDAEQNVYDAVIGYEHSRDATSAAAFNFSERSRARTLLSLTSENDGANTHHAQKKDSKPTLLDPLDAVAIRLRMPEQAQILQYSVLPEKILIWMISRTKLKTFEQPISTRELHEKVSSYLQLLSVPPANNEEEVKSASAEFYDLLVKPVEAELDSHKQLCVVPDKALNALPFGTFFSRSSGKYLVQDYVLTRAPSSTIFIVSSDKATDKADVSDERLLSVGNPSFNRAVFPALVDLPSAKRESEVIAGMYHSTPAITGAKASKDRVIAQMENADVIHLALHAVIDEHSPLLSKLVFAKSAASESGLINVDTLSISDIYRLRLPKTRLVVLSACQSGAGRYYDGEGVIGISRPFIARGVPLVVASLWPVDSDATADLMIAFHKNRKSGRSTAEALTLAQREKLVDSDKRYRQPYYWAPFVTIGGYARF